MKETVPNFPVKLRLALTGILRGNYKCTNNTIKYHLIKFNKGYLIIPAARPAWIPRRPD